jgi:hypothetical protein
MAETMASVEAIVERLRDLADAADYRAEDLATAAGMLDAADLLGFANLVESLHLRLQKGGERVDRAIVAKVLALDGRASYRQLRTTPATNGAEGVPGP